MFKDCLGKNCDKLKDKKLFLFDMDGTIYCENSLFDGVKELLNAIKKENGHYVFITNNASKSVNDYIKKIQNLGLEVDKDNFLTSVQAAVLHFEKHHNGARIYAQGTKSFIKELKDSGLDVTEQYDENADIILVGFDTEITAEKMRITSKMLTVKKDALYYATNPDWVCPVDFGYIPDCGSMCFGYEKATGRKPTFIGKPQPAMINIAMDKFGFSKEETLVIGDRLYTDIASGYNAGVDTVLVLSGEATMKDYEESDIKPTFVLNSVKDILEIKK
ncbi:MAG: HAD-IIA family hydrolase [Clostridia bacterium]|nr:HAD-IIA family hydrolase [Clostridia bacterium]